MNRVINFEIVRAKTLKSTWIFPAIGIGFSWFLAAIFIGDISPNGDGTMPTIVEVVNNAYSPLSIFFITIVFAQAFGHEYRDGTMRLTLSAFPNRLQVYIAKLIVPAVITVVSAMISCAGIALIFVQDERVDNSGLLQATLRHSAFSLMWGLIVAAVVIFTRNMAAGIAGVVVWTIILESLVGSMLATKFEKLPDYLPLSQGLIWSQHGGLAHLAVIVIATVLLIVLSALKFINRDA